MSHCLSLSPSLSQSIGMVRHAQLARCLSSTAGAFQRSRSSTERFSEVVKVNTPPGKTSQRKTRPLLRPSRSHTPPEARPLRSYSHQPPPTPEPPLVRQGSWQPTKKLTYSAMAGLRALHQFDSERFSKAALSKKFGVSHEAVTRILKSKFRDDKSAGGLEGIDALQHGLAFGQEEAMGGLDKPSLKGTKWDRDPGTSENVSPVPSIMRAIQESRRGR
ncbi:hypothetical protein L198_06335 [Cryptococcus wingfieldii CBS 7118]|uniref:Required for respiratory growth protein 9, mitochondrial n=1 Tax=Cryptococcus wingfieldii CBS 7118 TaxID=1295528 RepID=A0A1E3IM22_9TREE|nr:hypothetical protein L198_06335 [Cryptococcus wingfieldii CBS 7118]ODN89647.1 hypothetical protein L198_06335 [Cryptococcus wingfieldii CBS 7118]